MPNFELAQLNVALMKTPLDSPEMADFVANLDRINALAEDAPGFIWRLQTEEGNASELRPMGDEILINMSVWSDVSTLQHYVYRSGHVEIMRRRKEWFSRMAEAYSVLWWVPAGKRPTVEEAVQRLNHLRENGPTPYAFNFRKAFPSPDDTVSNPFIPLDDECPAF